MKSLLLLYAPAEKLQPDGRRGEAGVSWGGGKWVRVTAHPPRRQDQVWDADPLHKQPLSHFSLYLIKGMGTRIK